jgi:hypothetical protein
MIDRLTEHFGTALELPPDAAQWLLDLWRVIQMLDDVADNDSIEREELNSTIFLALVGLPANPFFQAHRMNLLPILATAVLKWQASNLAEQDGNADEKSFVWRAAYYDVVLLVVLLCHGVEKAANAAPYVMAMYGEVFADYLKEFPHA